MEDGKDSMESSGIVVGASDCPRVGRDFRVRTGDTPDTCWLVNGDLTILLNDSAAEIISRCDGRHSVGSLVEELNQIYQGASEQEIADGVRAFLELALQKGWVDIDLH